MGLAEPIEQNGSKKVNDNKDVKVLAIKGRKITIIIASTISAGGKMLIVLTKLTLPECM